MVTTRNAGSALRLTLTAAAALSLAACASHPKPTYPTAPPVAQRPEPPRGPSGPPPAEPVTQNALPGSERDFVINIGDRVYFDFDKYDVRSDAAPLLDAQTGWLKRYPAVQVRIEGNCDERGTREYNLALGARRANAVREYLVSHGVEAARISTVSYGKEKPIDPGSGDEADQHNRNGHTAIVSGARMQ
ncbi:MAG: OmpA family protein [Phenylobacterium sp.]|jgi:peptidoglycan-associated lipoprotein|uniref:peptidoglycan-associated lipoprotein Pal n=1 Tax=Phenylobacterium sp. TaxID=1871053 RepID=UPI00261EA96B|nr:peptidoglycan-associated lipoprotein Pal [Phenylobacterium sp.]MDB5426192.1 OmpA family protein [Phenylobacterium sp.]MDB5437027.1 OmpA family protein [Phenylobacterium sp.]MDB5465014.1 OmpA family protein [Phenylobacterium sp.]MDB5497914.1 OmpA family protein [Phenylobacterium sp.]